MKKNLLYILALAGLMFSCQPDPIAQEDLFVDESQVAELTADGKLYTLNDFVDKFMTEEGNYKDEQHLYRTRANNGGDIWLFSIDTIPTDGPGIYIKGRIVTEDIAGNFYKSMVIQEIVNGEQQALRISVDASNVHGQYAPGQEILIRCNGLAIGRYANQPQLCVPSYSNNHNAMNAEQKSGWAPGRIPFAKFIAATTRIGLPDPSKIVVEDVNISDFQSLATKTLDDQRIVRQWDGKLVRLHGVYFTGQYENNGTLANCTTGNPETDGNANVFAPTTENIGYPQSRIIADDKGNVTLFSNSEYCKFARYYIPEPSYYGTVTGILGNYRDNARYAADKYDWSITPRGACGYGSDYMNDLVLTHEETNDAWTPVEWHE